MEVLMLVFGVLFVLLVLWVVVAGVAVVRGITLSVLWTWFMVPIFHLPALRPAAAVALMLVIGYVFAPLSSSEEFVKINMDSPAGQKKAATKFFQPIISALSALAFGWVLKTFF